MRFRSLLALLVLGIASFGLVGCGDNDNTTDYVATTSNQTALSTGALTFNFITAQTAFTVDANTTTLYFDFYDGGASGTPVFSVTKPFESQITIEGIPVAARTVVITGVDANGIPLYNITQAISVVGGQTNTVDSVNNAVPITLDELRLAPGNVASLDQTLTLINVAEGGTTQVFLLAEYSDGSIVLLGDLATYSIEAGGEAIASVSTQALVSGLAIGSTNFIATYGGQTLQVPVSVTSQFAINFDSLSIVNAQPVVVATDTPVQISVVGNSGNAIFGLSPTDAGLSYSVDVVGFDIDASGVLSVLDTVPTGTAATVTVTYTNPNTTAVVATLGVTASTSTPENP